MEQSIIKFDYDAFISYRHIPRDSKIAEKLHKALEAYRTPSYLVKKGFPARLKKVFRDRDELPTSSDLGHDIEDALHKARFLIVICSPQTAQSRWVRREIEIFGAVRGYDKILTLLLEGEPAEAFPEGLIRPLYDEQGSVIKLVEPLAADIRADSQTASLKLLKTEKLRFLASILGCRFDDLRQREHERKTRRILTLSASIAAFLLSVTAFTVWQLHEVNLARNAAVKSEQQALSTQSSLFAALAKDATDNGDPLLGRSLALEALPKNLQNPEFPLTQDVQDTLYASAVRFGMQQLTKLYPSDATVNDTATRCFFSQKSGESTGQIVTIAEATVRLFDAATGRLVSEWVAPDGYIVLAVSPNAERTIVGRYTQEEKLHVQLWDLPQDEMLTDQQYDPNIHTDSSSDTHPYAFYLTYSLKVGFDSNEEYCFVALQKEVDLKNRASEIFLYNASSGEQLNTHKLTFDHAIADVFISGERLVAVKYIGSGQTNIYCYHIRTDTFEHIVAADSYAVHNDGGANIGVTSDGTYLSYVTRDIDALKDVLNILNLSSGESKKFVTDICEISDDGSLAAFFTSSESGERQFQVYSVAQEKALVTLEESQEGSFRLPSDSAAYFNFCGNNHYLVFYDGEMLNIDQGELYLPPLGSWACCSSDLDGKYLAALDSYGNGKVIQMQDQMVEHVTAKAAKEAVIRADGALLFEEQPGGRVIVQRWDFEQNKIKTTDRLYGVEYFYTISEATAQSVGINIGHYTDSEVLIYNTETGERMNALTMRSVYSDFLLDPTGRYLLVKNESSGIYLADTQTGEVIRMLLASDNDDMWLISMGFFSEGKYCWSAGYDRKEQKYLGVDIWDIKTGGKVNHIDTTVDPLCFYADGSRMLAYYEYVLQLWAIDANMKTDDLCRIYGEVLRTDSSDIYTLDSNEVRIYDAKTGQQKISFALPESYSSYSFVFLDGNRLLTMNTSSAEVDYNQPVSAFSPIELMLWDCNTGKAIGTLYKDYSLNTDILAFGLVNNDQEIAIVSTNNDKTYIRTIPFPASLDQVYEIAKEKLAGRIFQTELDIH